MATKLWTSSLSVLGSVAELHVIIPAVPIPPSSDDEEDSSPVSWILSNKLRTTMVFHTKHKGCGYSLLLRIKEAK